MGHFTLFSVTRIVRMIHAYEKLSKFVIREKNNKYVLWNAGMCPIVEILVKLLPSKFH